MMGATQTFDAEKFAKVRVMMDRGATEGERAAARDRAEAIAQRAGMTLKQAMSETDRQAKAKPYAGAQSYEDWMEAQEPGWKERTAKAAKERAEREAKKARQREEVLKEFGSAAAIFELTEIERALYEAATPFAKREWYDGWVEGRFAFTQRLGGYNVDIWPEKAPGFIHDLIRRAWPMPPSLEGMLAEIRMWDGLYRRRSLLIDGEYSHHQEVRIREWLLEDVLNNRPAAGWDDMAVRFEWALYKEQRQWMDPNDGGLEPFDERLRQDFEALRSKYEHPQPAATTNRRTNADKRRDVLAMMDAHPELSDREISRRCGVSPQTVSNWRAKSRGRPEQRNAA